MSFLRQPVIELTIPSLASLRSGLPTKLRAYRLDLWLLLLLTVVAAVLRLVMLEEIPAGLHGDEAWTGLDARRVLDEGWIGPYLGSALGQPTGPLYFAAPFIKVFGNSVFAVRFSMAVLGIATIPAAYLAFRVMFDRPLAVFGALLLAISGWHLHYSRLAFMVISWPLLEMITLFFLFLGMRTGRWLFYGLAGLAFGAGIYTYNAYPVFAVPLGLFLSWMLLQQQGPDLSQFLRRVALMIALAVFAALPMIIYAANTKNDYLAHHRMVSVLQTDRWKSGNLLDRADLVFDNARRYFSAAFWSGSPDHADGAGAEAMVDRLSLLLMIGGFAIFLWQWRRPSRIAVLLMVLLLPLGTILNTGGGKFRQTLGIVPFLAVLAAAPLALWWQRAGQLSTRWRRVSYAAIALIVCAIAYLNLSFYFGEFPDTEVVKYTFAQELADASQYLDDLPGDPYVYLYSGRWGFYYETRLFLAPEREGEDRSREFSATGSFSLEADRSRDVVYIFMIPYLEQLRQVERLYPGGTTFESEAKDNDGKPYFRAYYLPRLPGAAEGPPGIPPGGTPTAGPQASATPPARAGGEERDATRMRDLAALGEALEAYRSKHGSYPDNGGGIQTLCVFREFDVGCELEEVRKPLPEDPLGNPTDNGYFYSSNGRTYTIYARRDSERFPPCDQHPDHLAHLDSLLCARGP